VREFTFDKSIVDFGHTVYYDIVNKVLVVDLSSS